LKLVGIPAVFPTSTNHSRCVNLKLSVVLYIPKCLFVFALKRDCIASNPRANSTAFSSSRSRKSEFEDDLRSCALRACGARARWPAAAGPADVPGGAPPGCECLVVWSAPKSGPCSYTQHASVFAPELARRSRNQAPRLAAWRYRCRTPRCTILRSCALLGQP
jgi:hypothetical protein